MRLDKFLKVSRLIKRRTVANEACDAGRVLVNDRPAKASAQVKAGDVLEIQFGSKSVRVEVLNVQETMKDHQQELLSMDDVTAMIAGQIGKFLPMDEETAEQFRQLAKRMMEQVGK